MAAALQPSVVTGAEASLIDSAKGAGGSGGGIDALSESMAAAVLQAVSARDAQRKDHLYDEFRRCAIELRSHMGEITMLNRMQVPFPYFHMINLILLSNLLLVAYVTVPLASWPISMVIVVSLAIFLIGLRSVALKLSNPFGTNKLDFDLEGLMRAGVTLPHHLPTIRHHLPTYLLPTPPAVAIFLTVSDLVGLMLAVYDEAVSQMAIREYTPAKDQLPHGMHHDEPLHNPAHSAIEAATPLSPETTQEWSRPRRSRQDNAFSSLKREQTRVVGVVDSPVGSMRIATPPSPAEDGGNSHGPSSTGRKATVKHRSIHNDVVKSKPRGLKAATHASGFVMRFGAAPAQAQALGGSEP